jgi:DNA-binding transcriptional LysR family regulator
MADAEIATLPLFTEHYVVAGPPQWDGPLQNASWEDIAAMPWLTATPDSSQHGMVQRMFAERGLEMRSVVEADQESSMIGLIRSGVSLGLMRERIALAARDRGHVSIWPGARLPCALMLLFLRRNEASPIVRALVAAARIVWAMDSSGAAA